MEGRQFAQGRLLLATVGKAAWTMASAAVSYLDRKPDAGIVITKYGHNLDPIDGLEIWEAGHPVPDSNTFSATERAMAMT